MLRLEALPYVDVVVISHDHYAHLDKKNIQAIKDIQAKLFVPIYWSMFRLSTHHWLDPMMQSLKITKEHNIPMLNPFYGEIISIH